MQVASLELSKELFELSGWPAELVWHDDESPHLCDIKGHHGNRYPAYDSGYLLRKLPTSKVDLLHRVSPMVAWSNRWQKWFTHRERYGVGEDRDEWKQYHYKADTPEDAVAKLCIQLFKQGVLTKESL